MKRSSFDQLAKDYDHWFDSPESRILFLTETRCLQELAAGKEGLWLEVGVGTGRFAQVLGIEFGLDPSVAMLVFAKERGIKTVSGRGEALPYSDSSFDGVLIVTALCFFSDPLRVLQESTRVLKKSGCLILGMVPSDSAWGRLYQQKGRNGHPFYSQARFYSCGQIIQLAGEKGFSLDKATSGLISAPEEPLDNIVTYEGILKEAGFVGIRFLKIDACQ
ncbi:MAG: class I SAM-dependent methyltransferase [bacterium]